MAWSDLRKYPRTPVNLPVDCLLAGETHRMRALMLGGGGVLLGISQQFTPDSEFKVRFRPAKHLPTVEAKAKVCYSLPNTGIGLEFTEIRPEDRQMLLRLILHRVVKKRNYPRRPFVTQVDYEGGSFLGRSKNLSVEGMFIEKKDALTVGSNLKLRFHLEEGDLLIAATAEVLYAAKGVGMGVRFIYLSPTDRKRIEAFVANHESAARGNPEWC